MSDATTIEWVCETQETRVDHMFDALNLDHQGLEHVKAAYEAGNKIDACQKLIDYYREKANATKQVMKPVSPSNDTHAAAEQILQDTFTFQDVTGTVPHQADGSLDWTHRGPNDDREWAYFLNRHNHLHILLSAYKKTGNPSYVNRINDHIHEWVQVNPYPNEHTGDPRWRGLETMSRINVWARIFYALAEDDALKPATRILILSSIPDHAHYTQNFHNPGGNWLAMQMCALANGGLQWPEYKNADEWIGYATRTLLPEMKRQIYPDGPQKELASHYHGASLSSFQRYADLFEKAGRDVPKMWYEGLENMWNYWAYSMRPDGHGVLNNDSNLDFNRPRLLQVAPRYKRPDWAYIASNGQEGEQPNGSPSIMFPWAGQLIMRSGWDANAHWAMFDVGPWGIGHQHNDKLHLSVAAFGRDILVDAGRLYYKRDKWRDFIRSTAAHNTLLIDGKVQDADVKEVTEPLAEDVYQITDNFDYARGSFTAGYIDLDGKATHTRAMVYVRNKFWVVVDRMTTDRPRSIQGLWHYHPDCTVEIDGTTVTSTDTDKGNVRITPIGDTHWDIEMTQGQEEPFIQGWYSREYNHKAASPCVTYRTNIDGDAIFAWVITPGKGIVPNVNTELLAVDAVGVTVKVDEITVHIPIKNGQATVK
ncbi:MAG: alginate lyase family protein [Candidatus Latescibacteria bacterium]|nr:alginate lyase family protein [Candidatus Latescibacterota bacterium]